MTKSKIIIHNRTKKTDAEVLLYAWKFMREEWAEKAELCSATFGSGVCVEKVKRDTGHTLYFYE
jgi:hypothetical protein